MDSKHSLNFALSTATHARLKAMAAARDIPLTMFLRTIIFDYLASHGTTAAPKKAFADMNPREKAAFRASKTPEQIQAELRESERREREAQPVATARKESVLVQTSNDDDVGSALPPGDNSLDIQRQVRVWQAQNPGATADEVQEYAHSLMYAPKVEPAEPPPSAEELDEQEQFHNALAGLLEEFPELRK